MGITVASLIIAGAVALIKGTVDAIDSGLDDKKAREKIDAEQDYLDATYQNSLDQAEEEFTKAKEEAGHTAKRAIEEADLTDKSLDVTERGIANDINTAIDNMYLGGVSDAMSYNSASMQMASNEGAALSNLGASGIRAGSSLSDAVLMESATNASQLQFSEDAKRRSDNNNLAGVLNNLAGNRFNVMANRIGADVKREDAYRMYKSYLEGGHNYNLYKMETTGLNGNDGRLKLSYDYNKSQLEEERKQVSGANSFWKGVGAFFGGGATGFKSGYDISNTIYKGVNYGG